MEILPFYFVIATCIFVFSAGLNVIDIYFIKPNLSDIDKERASFIMGFLTIYILLIYPTLVTWVILSRIYYFINWAVGFFV